jgi:carotenoid 1,2-hydratase
VSDDGAWGVVLIAMLGNPFSPAYAKARRAGGVVDPLRYSALNVGVYNRDRSAWALTEQPIDASDRSASSLQIGQSSMRWEGERLVVDVHERAPWTQRPIRGRVVFTPDFTTDQRMSLDPMGRHSWWPVAPSGRLDVRLTEPNVRFSARGYHDSNAGDESLSAGFRKWTWSRAHVGDRTFITYDVELTDRTMRERAMSIGRDGLREEEGLVTTPMSRTRWGIERAARTEAGHRPQLVTRLEDTPFYSRDVISTKMGGREVRAMHETFSGTRLASKPVEFLLPFRMRSA